MENNFNSVPNQRNVTINKALCDKEHLYSKFNLDALQLAISTLTPSAFKLWCYLNQNRDEYRMFLSSIDFMRWGNISRKSYTNAVKELEEANYLILKSNTTNSYDFYEYPRSELDNLEIEKHFNEMNDFDF